MNWWCLIFVDLNYLWSIFIDVNWFWSTFIELNWLLMTYFLIDLNWSWPTFIQTVQEHLSPFGRGITRAWVGILSSLGVFSERGRFEVFFEVSWIHLSWWEGSQNWTWKLKNRVFGFFCTPSKMPNPHQKSTQFLLFSNHWVEGWLKRHKWLGQLG